MSAFMDHKRERMNRKIEKRIRKKQNLSIFRPMPREQKDIESIPGKIIQMAVVSVLRMEAIRKNFWKNGWTAIRFRQRLLSVKAMMK